tara:strand:- start:255 stop:575 length:321 start_codon:yes stop_codon:yes gene_type:complete
VLITDEHAFRLGIELLREGIIKGRHGVFKTNRGKINLRELARFIYKINQEVETTILLEKNYNSPVPASLSDPTIGAHALEPTEPFHDYGWRWRSYYINEGIKNASN